MQNTKRQRKGKKKRKSKSKELPCCKPEIYIKLTHEQRHSLISGYFLIHKKSCPTDINKVIESFYNDITYEYTISGNEFKKFMESDPGNQLISNTFDIVLNNHTFTFQLIVYPNGQGTNNGSVDLMIECLNDFVEYDINKLTFYLILYCHETGNETRGNRVISNKDKIRRWAGYSMKLAQCQKFQCINFKCYVDLLRIEYIGKNINFYSNNDCNTMNSNIEYSWKITKKFASIWGQLYYSKNFNSNFWAVICIPEGHSFDERSNFKLRLRLLRMPYNVHFMEIKFSLNIKGFEKYGLNKIAKFTINNDDNKNNYHLTFDHEQSVQLSQQSVWIATVTIQIVKLFDFKDKPIPPQQWSDHNVIYQCDPVKL
eukprot:461260_1